MFLFISIDHLDSIFEHGYRNLCWKFTFPVCKVQQREANVHVCAVLYLNTEFRWRCSYATYNVLQAFCPKGNFLHMIFLSRFSASVYIFCLTAYLRSNACVFSLRRMIEYVSFGSKSFVNYLPWRLKVAGLSNMLAYNDLHSPWMSKVCQCCCWPVSLAQLTKQ